MQDRRQGFHLGPKGSISSVQLHLQGMETYITPLTDEVGPRSFRSPVLGKHLWKSVLAMLAILVLCRCAGFRLFR